jgi:hypothetical protein
VVLQDRTVDCAKESLCVDVGLILLRAVTVAYRWSAGARAKGGESRRLRHLATQRIGDSPRHRLRQLDFVNNVTVSSNSFISLRRGIGKKRFRFP